MPPETNKKKYGKQSLVGKSFGYLKVLEKLPTVFTTGGNPKARWLCICTCGNKKVANSGELRTGKTKSCGCWLIESARLKGYDNKTHGGYSKSAPWDFRIKTDALANIRERAKRDGYESDLEISDLPELDKTCPILGIVFKKGTVKNKDFAPSVDRIRPELQYLKKNKDNLKFISHRANRIKSNATILELENLLVYLNGGGISSREENVELGYIKTKTLVSIRNRTRRRGYETDLEISDLPILGFKCPILGVAYTFTNKWTPASPSIDKFNPNLPYMKKYKDNLFYISYRANSLKSNASAEEIQKILSYMKDSVSEKTPSN